MERLIYNQKETITIPSGTTNIVEKEFYMESEFLVGFGVRVHEISNTGNDNYNIGFKGHDGRTYQNPTFKDDYISSTAVAPDERVRSMDFRADGQKVVVQIEPLAATTAEIKLQVIFSLSKYALNNG